MITIPRKVTPQLLNKTPFEQKKLKNYYEKSVVSNIDFHSEDMDNEFFQTYRCFVWCISIPERSQKNVIRQDRAF